jgi:hypothetical protein
MRSATGSLRWFSIAGAASRSSVAVARRLAELTALVEARRLKPSIPELGIDDIPISDEIDLEMRL